MNFMKLITRFFVKKKLLLLYFIMINKIFLKRLKTLKKKKLFIKKKYRNKKKFKKKFKRKKYFFKKYFFKKYTIRRYIFRKATFRRYTFRKYKQNYIFRKSGFRKYTFRKYTFRKSGFRKYKFLKWFHLSLKAKILRILKKKNYKILKKKAKLRKITKQKRIKIYKLKSNKFLNRIKKYNKIKYYQLRGKKNINYLFKLRKLISTKYKKTSKYFINNRFYSFRKYFFSKQLPLVGSPVSTHNNFNLRSHDFKLIQWEIEKKIKNISIKTSPTLFFKKLLFKTRRLNPWQRRPNQKIKSKWPKLRVYPRRRKFWQLRIRRRRKFKRYYKSVNRNKLLFYIHSNFNFNLEKLLIFLLNKNKMDIKNKFQLKTLYSLRNFENFQHIYLYLNNRNFNNSPVFSDDLFEYFLKNNQSFFCNNFVTRKKFFFKKLINTKKFFIKLQNLDEVKTQDKLSTYSFFKKSFLKKKKNTKLKYYKLKRFKNSKLKTKKIKLKKLKNNKIFNITKVLESVNIILNDGDALYLTSKSNKPFIIKNIGLFIVSKLNINKIKSKNTYKFRFKKKYYSFLAPNQLKKSILLIKSRIVLSRFFYRNKKKFNLFEYSKFSQKNFLYTFNEFFKSKLEYTKNNKLFNFSIFINDIFDKSNFLNAGREDCDKYGEVFIPRIRFKPGYQRLWRLARTALKESLRLNYRYQYRLTRYLMRFSRKINSYFLYYSEHTLERVVMYSKLLPDLNSFNFFLNNNAVYLNGIMAYNPKRIIYTNDFIQLIVSQWFYAFYRWLSNWTTLRNRKFKRLVYRKGLASKYKLMKTKKQKSRYTPNWIFNVRYDLIDVRPNLEVDYFTLSVFYIYEPYTLQHYPINELSEKRHHIYRLYNWKYIT